MLLLVITGALLVFSLGGMAFLQDLRQHTIPFLALYGFACVAYGVAVAWCLRRSGDRRTVSLILGLAVLFRVVLLFSTPPTLSDDVYRYIWDGRLSNAGVNPYAHAVNSPALDPYDTPLRQLVNHREMASPYLPSAQALFALVYRLSPESPLAFQVAAVLFDLLTGLVILDLLRRFGLPGSRVLIYLWNPLVIVEFAHGAHVDALMIFLMMASFWLLMVARHRLLSVLSMAAATLTKGLPLLISPVLAWRWGWRGTAAYLALLVAACLPFAQGAGWGLSGPLDGTGLFGALRIYVTRWNYNSGIYHWLEVVICGYPTPGAVPPDVVGWGLVLCTKLVVVVGMGLALGGVWWWSRKCDDDLTLLRLAAIPLAAYLLLTTTVHPWYVVVVIPLFPFLPSAKGETSIAG